MFLAIHGLTRSAQTAGRVLGFSTGIRMNDMFKQQQAKNHKEVVDKTVEKPARYSRKNIMDNKTVKSIKSVLLLVFFSDRKTYFSSY